MTKFGFSAVVFGFWLVSAVCARAFKGNCDDDFLNQDEFYMCQGGIEGVLMGENDEPLPCPLISRGTCSPYVCCENVAVGNCIDNFLYMDKEYLCQGGSSGVVDVSCRIASDGSCESVECCEELGSDNDYSFSFSYSFMDYEG